MTSQAPAIVSISYLASSFGASETTIERILADASVDLDPIDETVSLAAAVAAIRAFATARKSTPSPKQATTIRVAGLMRETGYSRPTVEAALRKAALRPLTGYDYDREAALEAVAENVDIDTAIGMHANGHGGKADLGETRLSQLKAESEKLKAEKLAFDLDVKRGAYLPAEAVREAGRSIIVRARAEFTSIGARCADKLIGLEDPAEISAILRDEVETILRGLADIERAGEAQ